MGDCNTLKTFPNPHHCDPHLDQTKFNDLLPLTIDGVLATWLDSELWKILKAATGLLIPRTTTNTAWDCVLPVPVAGRGVSKARWQDFLLEFEALDESKLLTSEP